jgi:hypothetical protein
MTPNEHLTYYSRLFPDAWKKADMLRDGRGSPDYPDWPGWCFLPISAWNTIIDVIPNNFTPENIALAANTANLAALGAWRYTQGIYRFHPQLYEALINTPHSNEMPIDVLMRLPEWCIYIEVPQTFVTQELPVAGFFVYLEFDKFPELRFVFNIIDLDATSNTGYANKDFLFPAASIFLRQYSVIDAINELVETQEEKILAEGIVLPPVDTLKEEQHTVSEILSKYLSLVLYICSEDPQIDGGQTNDSPRHPTPTKTKRGRRLFPPPKPRIWKVGEKIGEVLEKADREYAERPPRQPGDPIPRRAHIRRAHWHTYWRGPRKPDPDMPDELQKPYKTIRWMRLLEVGTGSG